MITILFQVIVKDGKEEDFYDLTVRLTKITRAEDDGCVAYVWHQRQDVPREFVLYEQWRDKNALEAHIEHLVALYGPPEDGVGLPATILDLCEHSHGVVYDVVA